MNEKKIVLVTGVAGYWGSRLAARLAAEENYHVIGLDAKQPAHEIEGLDFIQADVRNPLLVDLFKAEAVDAVCHLAFVETARPSEAAFDLNVMGTAKVLGACEQAGVGQVVLKSSTAVYGARPSNPAFLKEEQSLRGNKRYGTVKDLVEIETFCSGFRRRASDLALTILRFPSIVGPTADTPMTRFLADPQAPSLLGFDPLMQLVHEDDVVAALVHAVVNDAPGVFNVAAEEVLPLNKIRGLAGKAPFAVLHLAVYWRKKWLGRAGRRFDHHLPIDPDYMRYSWVADLARMGEELGFEPRHRAEETLREFAEKQRVQRDGLGAVSLARDEERLRTIIAQRQQTGATAKEEGDDD